MSVVPENPSEFFTQYLPARFGEVSAGLEGKTSVGSMLFRVPGAGEWSFKLVDGKLDIQEGAHDDVLLQVTVSQDDFGPIFVQAAQQNSGALKPEQQVMAFKALTIDTQRADMIRKTPGTVAFMVADGAKKHQLSITPGSQQAKLESPDCKLECTMADFIEMQTGKSNPMQLVMGGKLKIVGNAQLPMALSSVIA